MNRNLILPLLGALLLTACGEAQSESVSTQQTTVTTAASVVTGTTAASETTASAVSTSASGTTVQTSAAHTSLSTESAALPETTASALESAVLAIETTATLLQGGGGGEEHAEDIDPLYFNYLFGEDEAAVRLAGGTYQVISFDFTEALDHDVDEKYYLQDADFDGDLDLCVPVRFANADTEHAVFRWNTETEQFDVQPVLIMNPVFHAEKKQITGSQQVSETKRTLMRYAWENGTLKMLETADADSKLLTLVRQMPDGKQTVLKPKTEAELEKAVNDFLVE